MTKAIDIGRYIVNQSVRVNKPITILDVQTILILAQVKSIINNDTLLFKEKIIKTKYFYQVIEVVDSMNWDNTQFDEEIKEYTELSLTSNPFRIEIIKHQFDENLLSEIEKNLINEIIKEYNIIGVPQMRKTIETVNKKYKVIDLL